MESIWLRYKPLLLELANTSGGSVKSKHLSIRKLLLRLLPIVCICLKSTDLCGLPPTPLKVALYPYLPDTCRDNYLAFENRIEEEFETLYPDIDLILRPLNATGSFYEYSNLVNLIKAYDIVETDSLYLGRLIENQLLSPWPKDPCKAVSWQAIPEEICQGAYPYSWPHWQCGYFLFGQLKDLNGINSLESFEARLNAVPENKIPLIINFYDRPNLSNIYIDALTDQSANTTLEENFCGSLCEATFTALETLANYTCTPKGYDPALKGFYDHHSKAGALLFAQQKATYYIGYSEDYSLIEESFLNRPLPFAAIHAPWGPYHRPTIAVDSLVLAKGLPEATQAAALLFAEYLTAPSTYQWMVLGEDCPEKSHPRYLLPGSQTAYSESTIGETPMMLDYYQAIQSSPNSMPWQYYSLIYEAMGEKLYTHLNDTTTCNNSM